MGPKLRSIGLGPGSRAAGNGRFKPGSEGVAFGSSPSWVSSSTLHPGASRSGPNRKDGGEPPRLGIHITSCKGIAGLDVEIEGVRLEGLLPHKRADPGIPPVLRSTSDLKRY